MRAASKLLLGLILPTACFGADVDVELGRARRLWLDFRAAEPWDAPAAALMESLVRQSLAGRPDVAVIPESRVRRSFGEQGVEESDGASGCSEAAAALLGAPLVLQGVYSRHEQGARLDLRLCGARAPRRGERPPLVLALDEDWAPGVRTAARALLEQALAADQTESRPPRGEAGGRRGIKDPVKAFLWGTLPGGSMFYAGRPGWGGVYAVADSALLALFSYYWSAGPARNAFPFGAAGLTVRLASYYHGLNAVAHYNRTRALVLRPEPGGVSVAWRRRF